MAVVRTGRVVSATADGDVLTGVFNVTGVKIVGGASGMTVNLKRGVTGGAVMYTGTVGNSASLLDLAEFRCSRNIYVNISAGSGTVYLYLK